MRKNTNMTTLIITVTLVSVSLAPDAVARSQSRTANIIPIPVHIEHRKGFFSFSPDAKVITEKHALAEVAWSEKQLSNYDEFLTRLRHHLKRLDARGINYRKIKTRQ
jgi:hypothetical protein